MSDSFEVAVYTPAGEVFSGKTSSVKVPTAMGEIDILAGHQDYVSVLGTGIFQYRCEESDTVRRAVVCGGFVRFVGKQLSVLADSVDVPENVDKDSYSDRREEFSQAVSKGSLHEPEIVDAQQQLRRIEAIDRLISH